MSCGANIILKVTQIQIQIDNCDKQLKRINLSVNKLTLHMPAAPNNIVQTNFVLPTQPNSFKRIPFG